MKFMDSRWLNAGRILKPATMGYVKQKAGSAKIHRCEACQRTQLFTKIGVQYLCAECRGGQG